MYVCMYVCLFVCCLFVDMNQELDKMKVMGLPTMFINHHDDMEEGEVLAHAFTQLVGSGLRTLQ